MFSVLLGIKLRREILGHTVFLSLTFHATPTLFSNIILRRFCLDFYFLIHATAFCPGPTYKLILLQLLKINKYTLGKWQFLPFLNYIFSGPCFLSGNIFMLYIYLPYLEGWVFFYLMCDIFHVQKCSNKVINLPTVFLNWVCFPWFHLKYLFQLYIFFDQLLHSSFVPFLPHILYISINILH